MTTGERLRMLREKSGKSQGEVAKLIGISRPAYVSYETGRSFPSRKIRELAELFGVTTDYLLNEDIHINVQIKDAPSYTKEEEAIIEMYRFTDSFGKKQILRTAEENAQRVAEETNTRFKVAM